MSRRLRTAAGWVAVAFMFGCVARSQGPPEPGYERGGVPELRGSGVMVLPLQISDGAHPDLDREVEYALRQSEETIQWVMPDALRELLDRSPGAGIPIDDLPVAMFRAGEIQRVGDPLFGHLYRLGALSGAGFALLPVEARAYEREEGESVAISAALLDTRTGRVIWFGIVEGTVGLRGDLSPSATAAEALARRISR